MRVWKFQQNVDIWQIVRNLEKNCFFDETFYTHENVHIYVSHVIMKK